MTQRHHIPRPSGPPSRSSSALHASRTAAFSLVNRNRSTILPIFAYWTAPWQVDGLSVATTPPPSRQCLQRNKPARINRQKERALQNPLRRDRLAPARIRRPLQNRLCQRPRDSETSASTRRVRSGPMKPVRPPSASLMTKLSLAKPKV